MPYKFLLFTRALPIYYSQALLRNECDERWEMFFLKSYLTLASIKVGSIAPLSPQLIKNKLSFTLPTINFEKALALDKIYKKYFLSSMFLSPYWSYL